MMMILSRVHENKNSQWYFKAFSGQSDGQIFEEKVPLGKDLGFANVKVLLADGAPRGCLYLRRDMAVLDTNLKSQNEFPLYGENGRLQALVCSC